MNEPSTNRASNGRGPGGRFAKGNGGGPGNPNAANASKRRAEFWLSIKSSDVRLAVQTIRTILKNTSAKDADKLAAAREILNRVCGVPVPSDILERLQTLESAMALKGGIDLSNLRDEVEQTE
jgi:hypothetical protein